MREYCQILLDEVGANLFLQTCYVVLASVYLYTLSSFNNSIDSGMSPVDIMFQDSGRAWYLLVFAVLLIVVAVFLGYYHVRDFLSYSGISMLAIIVFLIILAILVISIISLINVPILRAALVVVFGGTAFVIGLSNSY